MLSRVQTILAIALPLGLCLFFSIPILLCCVHIIHRQHRQHQRDTERANMDLSELQKRLKSFPEAWKDNDVVSGFSDDDVRRAFVDFSIAVSNYVSKWIIWDTSPPRFNESLSRIEALLFPEPAAKHGLNANKDIRIFRNPHNYTTAEIKLYLEQDHTRRDIATHLMMSIILPNVSVDGDPFKTLLPFPPSTVCALDRLFTSIRYLELFDDVPIHISKFGFYFALKPEFGQLGREMYRTLFGTLFEPYLTSQPQYSSKVTRDEDFNDIMDKAVRFGMVVLGHIAPPETQWGGRIDNGITYSPALRRLDIKDRKLEQYIQLVPTSYEEDRS